MMQDEKTSESKENHEIFVNQLSHELRTPLAISVGNVRRALRLCETCELDRFGTIQSYLSVADQELQRITRLINHLTILTDIDTKSLRWKANKHQLVPVIHQWYEKLEKQQKEHLYLVGLESANKLLFNIDVEAIEIILNNLLDNSMRYGPKGEHAMLYLKKSEKKIYIYYADWGYGISKELQADIFSRFRRLEEHRDPSRADGSGLGLTVSKELLKLMNSELELVSTQKPSGKSSLPNTVLKITMPVTGESKDQDPTSNPDNSVKNSAQDRDSRCSELKNFIKQHESISQLNNKQSL